jgi:hypothetical protein
MTEPTVPPQRFSRKEAAACVRDHHHVPCTPGTLQKYATTGGGPPYCRWGNATIYEQPDLDKWVAEKLKGPRCASMRNSFWW